MWYKVFYKEFKAFDDQFGTPGKLKGTNTTKHIETAVSLKYLSNFQRTLGMRLTNCEVFLILRWSASCVLTRKAAPDADPGADPAVAAFSNPTDATLAIPHTFICTSYQSLSWYKIMNIAATKIRV